MPPPPGSGRVGSGGEAYFAQFAPDAVVEDEGTARHGIGEIRAWRTEVATVDYAVQEIRAPGPGRDAVVVISGDFPGSPVALTFSFEFTGDGHIAFLAINP
jgi:hypothetical protein